MGDGDADVGMRKQVSCVRSSCNEDIGNESLQNESAQNEDARQVAF